MSFSLEFLPRWVEIKSIQEEVCSVFLLCEQFSSLLLLPHGHQWGLIFILYVVSVTLDISWYREFLELDSEDKLQPVSYFSYFMDVEGK